MPKAKYKRKGTPFLYLDSGQPKKVKKDDDDSDSSDETPVHAEGGSRDSSVAVPSDAGCSSASFDRGECSTASSTILCLPEEIVRLILDRLDISSVAALESTCHHLRRIILNSGIWRKILAYRMEYEPGLRRFLSNYSPCTPWDPSQIEHLSHKAELENLIRKVDYVWHSSLLPTITRTNKINVWSQSEPQHHLYSVVTTGRYLAAFYSTDRLVKAGNSKHDIFTIDIFDRATSIRLRRLTNIQTKPEVFRLVDELGLCLITYPGQLMIEQAKFNSEEIETLQLGRLGEVESGSVCDIVVRENISIRGLLYRRVVMVSMNTEPLDNWHFHIGELQMYQLADDGEIKKPCLWNFTFLPVPLSAGRFFNQCIQKKGLTDFNDEYAVVVIGGCEGTAVLGVVDIQKRRVAHKLQLRGARQTFEREGGCEGGACQYSVVSLMIDRLQPHMCAVLLSTGQLNVIHLPSGDTLFHRHLQFDGQLKHAMHQPRLVGNQRIGIKFRNSVTFYDLHLSSRASNIKLVYVRTLWIRSMEWRDTKLDIYPSQELRRQFGELQKQFKALNRYTSGIQKKLDKGLRPGTVTQGMLSMTKKVELVASKLDEAHGKARQINAIVIDSISFDNRFCHALTFNRDLVIFDLASNLGFYPNNRRRSLSVSASDGASSPDLIEAGESSRASLEASEEDEVEEEGEDVPEDPDMPSSSRRQTRASRRRPKKE